MTLKYSDGDIELRLEHVLSKTDDLSSQINIAPEEYGVWPMPYYLRFARANVIRHFDFTNLDVLELGAGVGALSRYIAEKCKHLTSIEGAKQRFKCLSLRMRGLNNWDGYLENFQDFKTDKKYDVVIFNGVLEYSGLFIDDANPFEFAIKQAKSFLNQDGVLIISIENKLGIRYFSGLVEDHLNQPYYGILGYPLCNNGVKTFSIAELSNMLLKSGFSKIDVQHLAPDYKFTRAVLTDKFVKNHPDVSAQVLGKFPSIDYVGNGPKALFSEQLALSSIASSGLLREFANSHLYLAYNEDSTTYKKLLSENFLGVVYTEGRKTEIKTEFVQTANGDMAVKSNMFNGESIISETPVFDGKTLEIYLLNFCYYYKREEFLTLLKKFISFIFKKYTKDGELDGVTFDAMPSNVIIQDDEEFKLFDLEYTYNLSQSDFIFRVVLNLSLQFSMEMVNRIGFGNWLELYNYLSAEFNLSNDWFQNIKHEQEFVTSNSPFNVPKEKYMQLFGVEDLSRPPQSKLEMVISSIKNLFVKCKKN